MVSAETLRVRIEAEDAASATLERIGTRAIELERALEQLESRGGSPTPSAEREPRAEDRRTSSRSATFEMRVEDRASAAVIALGELLGTIDGRVVRTGAAAETGEAERRMGELAALHAGLDGRGSTVEVQADTAEALGALAMTRAEHAALDGKTASMRVTADGAEAAAAALRHVGGAAIDREVTVAVRAETAGAQAALAATAARHGALDGAAATMVVGANAAGALGAMAGAMVAHGGLDGATATMRIEADTSGARSGIGWAAGYAGRVLATSYIDIVTRRMTVGIGPTARHGGVPARAHDGVALAEMHEAGPEVLHGPSGERGMTSGRGVYAVRAGTYVSPAPASREAVGGMTISVAIHGNVYGMDDLTEQVTRKLAPVIAAVASDIHGSQVRVS